METDKDESQEGGLKEREFYFEEEKTLYKETEET